MSNLFAMSWFVDLLTNLAVSMIMFVGGYALGKHRERRLLAGRNLEQYECYPFSIDADGFPAFSPPLFARAIDELLARPDATAAAQLIVLGEQNGVRYQLDRDALVKYERLYARHHGNRVLQDSSDYLENYRRVVRLFGQTFRDMGIEILLHDLVNPARSITCIAGGEVTGRSEGMGTTSLVIDLKRRRHLNQDKTNYCLEIGARRFKCTTIPIVREPFGIVGAICINIDINYIRDVVLPSPTEVAEFFRKYCAIDMWLEENILSRPEYDKALAGKRHWRE
jgi:hypothetical protein